MFQSMVTTPLHLVHTHSFLILFSSNDNTNTSTTVGTVSSSHSIIIEETTCTSTIHISPFIQDKPPDNQLPPNLTIITQEDDDNYTVATEMSYTFEEESINVDINNHLLVIQMILIFLDTCAIIGYRTTANNILEFEVEFMNKATTFYPYSTVETDHIKALADFILANQNNLKNASLAGWACLFKRKL